MSKVISEKLLSGTIFGDHDNREFIYLPGGEVGTENPICVFEHYDLNEDLPLEEASELVLRLALKPVKHPLLGKKSF